MRIILECFSCLPLVCAVDWRVSWRRGFPSCCGRAAGRPAPWCSCASCGCSTRPWRDPASGYRCKPARGGPPPSRLSDNNFNAINQGAVFFFSAFTLTDTKNYTILNCYRFEPFGFKKWKKTHISEGKKVA